MKNISIDRFCSSEKFDGGICDRVSEKFIFFQVKSELYIIEIFFAELLWRILGLKKKINEIRLWTFKEIKPSNGMQNHKSKKDFKFNFVQVNKNTTS